MLSYLMTAVLLFGAVQKADMPAPEPTKKVEKPATCAQKTDFIRKSLERDLVQMVADKDLADYRLTVTQVECSKEGNALVKANIQLKIPEVSDDGVTVYICRNGTITYLCAAEGYKVLGIEEPKDFLCTTVFK